MKFHHIGIACEDIHNMIDFMKQHFELAEISEIVFDRNQDARLCMLELSDGIKIELVTGNMVQAMLRKKKYLYHICYEVADIEAKANELCNSGGGTSNVRIKNCGVISQ